MASEENLQPEDQLAEQARETKRKKLTDKQKEKKQQENLKLLLDMPIFREFLWRVLSQCRIYDHHFFGEEGQRQEGKRHVGLWLLKEILQVKPNSYTIMQQEDREREEGLRQ